MGTGELVLRVGVLAGLGAVLVTLAKWRRRRAKYDGFDGLASWSAAVTAALRALESERPDRLFNDFLAKPLSGPQYDAVRKFVASAPPPPPADPTKPRRIEVMTLRTRYFDDVILAAVAPHVASTLRDLLVKGLEEAGLAGQPPPGLVESGQAQLEPALIEPGQAPSGQTQLGQATPGQAPSGQAPPGPTPPGQVQLGHPGGQVEPIRQVVLLGSGLDSRPWRMDHLAQVRWWDLDQRDVIQWKSARLAAEGVEVGSAQEAGREVKVPLKVASWKQVVGDLERAGWSHSLLAQGLDKDHKCLWVLEGLLYYLAPSAMDPLFEELGSVCAPGSWLLMDSFTEESLAAAHAKLAGKEGIHQGWKCGLPEDIAGYFKSKGWTVVSDLFAEQACELLGFEYGMLSKNTMHYLLALKD